MDICKSAVLRYSVTLTIQPLSKPGPAGLQLSSEVLSPQYTTRLNATVTKMSMIVYVALSRIPFWLSNFVRVSHESRSNQATKKCDRSTDSQDLCPLSNDLRPVLRALTQLLDFLVK